MGKTKSGDDNREEKRSKKKHKKEKKKKHERSSKKKKSKEKLSSPDTFGPLPPSKLPEASKSEEICGPSPPPEIAPAAKSFAPMSKEDWERQQSVIRRVYDEETGRSRLVKGDGEILEEIVSRDRHKEINRKATLGDGQYFQSVISQNVKK